MCSCVANLPTCCMLPLLYASDLSNPLTVVLGIREADVCLVYNKHMPNQSLCSYTLFLNINPGLRVCQWRQVTRQICAVMKYCALVIESGRWRRTAAILLASESSPHGTNSVPWVMLVSVSQCKYSAQCLGCYMRCHVCIAWHWHIVTNCGNAPSWYVTKPSAGKRCNSRDLVSDPSQDCYSYHRVYARHKCRSPTLRCEVNVYIKDLKSS